MTPSRFELKPLVEFLKREFHDKRPKEIDLLLVKQRAILSRGALPELQIRATPGSRHVVDEDLGSEHRIYFFAENGSVAGAINVPINSPWLAKLWKGSRILYHLPKKLLEVRPEQVAEEEYQRFAKVYAGVAALWGAPPTPPPLLIVPATPDYCKHGPDIGTTSGNPLNQGTPAPRQVSLDAIQGDKGQVVLAREGFRNVLVDTGCFVDPTSQSAFAFYFACIYCGVVVAEGIDSQWAVQIPGEMWKNLAQVLPQRPKSSIEKYLRAAIATVRFLVKIGEQLPPSFAVILLHTLLADFLQDRTGRNERLVVEFYYDCAHALHTRTPATPEWVVAFTARAMLAHAIFASDLKLPAKPDVAMNAAVPLLMAIQALFQQKYQSLLDILNRAEHDFAVPIKNLARMAIAAQIRTCGLKITMTGPNALVPLTPVPIEILAQNITDIILYNAEVELTPQPTARLQVGEIIREGPVDFHKTLRFRCTITALTAGSATLTVQVGVNHPCTGEKRVTSAIRLSFVIE